MPPPTCSLYLTADIDRRQAARSLSTVIVMAIVGMRINRGLQLRLIRLPGIHHDSTCILLLGSTSSAIIDPGTSWYQVNVEARIAPHLEGRAAVEHILLTHRHFDSAGAALHLSVIHGADIRVHMAATNALSSGDPFTTWASRYDSDMPIVDAGGFEEGESIDLGDTIVEVIHTPGHTVDSVCFHIADRGAVICGDTIPSASHPSRADMPTGNLIELAESLEKIRALKPKLLVCGRGEPVKGSDAVDAVLSLHIESVEQRIESQGALPDGWPKPAPTCHWLTPEPAWD